MRNILILVILTAALIFTSLIKNKTRMLEKEIVNLNDVISSSNFKLTAATIEFEFLTTPKNISFLAKNYLYDDFSFYKKSQIMESIEVKEPNQNKNFVRKASLEQTISLNSHNQNDLHLKQASEPEKHETPNEVRRWVGIQLIKALMGFPTVPVK